MFVQMAGNDPNDPAFLSKLSASNEGKAVLATGGATGVKSVRSSLS